MPLSSCSSRPPPLQVFCIAEDDSGAEELKLDVRKFLYDLRMAADVIVVTMKAWEDVVADEEGAEAELERQGALEAFTRVRMGGSGNSQRGHTGTQGPLRGRRALIDPFRWGPLLCMSSTLLLQAEC